MRILVTGAAGFAGQHLMRYLHHIQPQAELHGTVYRTAAPAGLPGIFTRVDLCQAEAVLHLLQRLQPDCIYHLAGQAAPAQAFKQPWHTLETNIRSQFNLLEGCREIGLQPRFLCVTSAEVYGVVQPQELPLREDAPLRPASPYGLSKITQDLMGWQYFLSYSLPVIRARAFNHTGPGQGEDFVVAALALQIARIEAGRQSVLHVGNLSARRDFTDVRDMVRAYHALMQHGQPGEVYNIASGTAHSIDSILQSLRTSATVPVSIQIDTSRLRPSDIPVIQGDATRLHRLTGWQPQITIEQTLRDLLQDCRQRVH